LFEISGFFDLILSAIIFLENSVSSKIMAIRSFSGFALEDLFYPSFLYCDIPIHGFLSALMIFHSGQ
jgi:hypothetical protein